MIGSSAERLGAPQGRLSAVLALTTVTLVGVVMLFALALGYPEAAVAVPLIVGVVYGLYKLPLKVSVLGILCLVLTLEGLEYTLGDFEHEWQVPLLYPIARVLLLNVSTVMGGGPLKFPIIDLATVALFVLSVTRHPRDGWVAKQPTVRAMHMALWTSAIAASALIVIGLMQGGSFTPAWWQARHMLMFPLRAVILMRALDYTGLELKLLGRLLVGAAVFKAAVGLWFFYGVAPGMDFEPQFTTSHADTLLFVPALGLYVARAIEARRGREVFGGLLWAGFVFWGLVANDRRISYVSLCIGVVVMLVMAPPTPMKRVLSRALIVATPLLPWYVLAGWGSDGKGWFFPVGVLRSLVVGEKVYAGQIDYRDIENLDVVYTWSQHKVLPMGFGHPFDLLIPLPDIAAWFADWQFHPHNALLWLFAIGGPIGFTLLMLPHLATLFLAARAYRASTDFTERVALLVCIVTVVAFLNQLWGDMGSLQRTASWVAALAAAIAAKLALKTRAWPTVLRVKREAEG